jgi:hypothetical protein
MMKISRKVPQQSPKSSVRAAGPQAIWTHHLKEEDKASFLELMTVTNGPVLQRLLQLVQDAKTKSIKTNLKATNYDSPSWAYTQADNIGYQRALDLVELLLKDIVK